MGGGSAANRKSKRGATYTEIGDFIRLSRMWYLPVSLLSIYIQVIAIVISGWVMSCDSTHSCRHGDFIVLPQWGTRPPTPGPDILLRRPDTEPILIIASTWLGSDKYKKFKSLI